MLRTRLAMLAALVAAGAVALAACSSTTGGLPQPGTDGNHQPARLASDVRLVSGTALANHAPDNTGDFVTGARNTPPAKKWVQLSASSAGDLNPVVVDGVGFTLYRFDKDTAHPSKSNCDGSCAQKWPPVEVSPGSRIFVDGVSPSKVGVIKRDDGALQVTIGGLPVYRFSGDTAPGQTNGQGVGGTWFGVTPTGGKAGVPDQSGSNGVGYVTGTAAQHKAPPNTGDFYNGPSNSPAARKWVQLTASSAGDLNPVVVNGTGFVLYEFDKDTAHPSKSNCDGSCAQKWPPVVVSPGSHIFVNGVQTSLIGLVKRDDGLLQVTIAGHPIYRFTGDTAPGQTNGEGVGGTWYAITPTGGKSLPPAGADTAPPTTTTTTTAPSVTLGNGTVTLFDSLDPADDTAQQLAGPGCQNVPRPNVAQRLNLDGDPVKIWTGQNCTGTSHVVTASITDLNTIGFGNKIESVRFGS